MKVQVDRQLCSGHAMCFARGPDFYQLDDLGYNIVDGEIEVPVGLEDQARSGMQACPERAISLVEEQN